MTPTSFSVPYSYIYKKEIVIWTPLAVFMGIDTGIIVGSAQLISAFILLAIKLIDIITWQSVRVC
jgi:hypothetical protein